MTALIKIAIPDAGPINMLAAAGLLDLLMAPKNTEIIVIQSVLNEILSRSAEFQDFLDTNKSRIKIERTSVCVGDAEKTARGESIGKGRVDLAIADFMLTSIDEVLGNAPALVIFEDKKFGRLSQFEQFSENIHFITTAAYLRKLEAEGIIDSFDAAWAKVVSKSSSPDPKGHREPNSSDGIRVTI